MIVLGSNSEIAQAFVEKVLEAGEKYSTIFLFTSNKETTEKFARHIDVKFFQQTQIIELDLMKELDYNKFDDINSDLLFCATGFLGDGTEEGLYNNKNTQQVIDINYAKLIPVLNFFAGKMERQRSGTMTVLSLLNCSGHKISEKIQTGFHLPKPAFHGHQRYRRTRWFYRIYSLSPLL